MGSILIKTWTADHLRLCNLMVVWFSGSKVWSAIWMLVHKMIEMVWISIGTMTLSKFNNSYLSCNQDSMGKHSNMMTETVYWFLDRISILWTISWSKWRNLNGTLSYFFLIIYWLNFIYFISSMLFKYFLYNFLILYIISYISSNMYIVQILKSQYLFQSINSLFNI